MGMLSLNRLMLKEERRRRRRIQARNGSTLGPQKKDSLCQEGGHYQGGERSAFSVPNLPEDIWCHIHSLMPLRDSAGSACVSRTFLWSWRCRPKLTFTAETLGLKENTYQKSGRTKGCPKLTFTAETLGLKENTYQKSGRTKDFTWRVDQILKNHSGVGVKSLKIVIDSHHKVDACHVNSWLRSAISLGTEEVTLHLSAIYGAEYNFPCSLLLDVCGNSIRYLHLSNCAFHPPVGFDCLKSLTKLYLIGVRITGDELECLISRSFCLEQLELISCEELVCLKIPFWLDRLSWLNVSSCNKLQVIDSTAPNLSTFELCGYRVQLLLGESSPVKNLNLGFSSELNSISYAITKLPLIVHILKLLPYILAVRVNTPMVANKFLHLKYLNIDLADDDDDETTFRAYDYMSLVSFLDASPVLETFILSVDQRAMHHESVFGDASSHLRQIPEHKHARLRKVQVNGFCSAKSMVELTCHILENSTALESLTLDSIFSQVLYVDDIVRCSGLKTGKCIPKSRQMVVEAHKALKVIERYIMERVPSTVKLNIRGPCIRCHAIDESA